MRLIKELESFSMELAAASMPPSLHWGVACCCSRPRPGQFDTVVLRRDPQRVARIKQDETTNIFHGVFCLILSQNSYNRLKGWGRDELGIAYLRHQTRSICLNLQIYEWFLTIRPFTPVRPMRLESWMS